MVKVWTLFCSVILGMAAILFSPSLALGATTEIKTAGGDGGDYNGAGGAGGVGGGGGGGGIGGAGGGGGLGGGGGGIGGAGGGGGGGGLGGNGDGVSGTGGTGISVGNDGHGGAGAGGVSGGSGLGGGGGGGNSGGGGGGGGLGSGWGAGAGAGEAGSSGMYSGSDETIGSNTGYSGADTTGSSAGGGGGGSAGLVVVGNTAPLTETYTGGKGGTSGADYFNGGLAGGGGGGVGLVNYRGGEVIVNDSVSITGGAGGIGVTGGGGGAAVFMVGANRNFYDEGKASGGKLTNSGTITGGSGGAAQLSGTLGGRGGHGIAANNAVIVNSKTLSGGIISGGDGGNGDYSSGGGGGHGIDLFTYATLDSSITNSGTISGGNAGGLLGGGMGNINGGSGGDGITAGGKGITITNTGTIIGGNGGAHLNSGTMGSGGVGVRLENNLETGFHLITSGSIRGGMGSDNITQAKAVDITGNDNIVELRSGYSFTGNVTANGTGNILRLGGDTTPTASFNVISIGTNFSGFDRFEKTGSSDWTLSGFGMQSWTIRSGRLIGNAGTFNADQYVESGASIVFYETLLPGTFNSVISGAGGLTKTGVNRLELESANTYTGATTISEGVLALRSTGSIANSSSVIVAAGAGFSISDTSTTTVKALEGEGQVALGSNKLSVGSGNTSTTFSGLIDGASGTLTKEGTGSFTLSGSNLYTGGTTIQAGEIIAKNISALGTGGVTIAATGTLTLDFGSGVLATGNILGGAGTLNIEDDLTINHANSFTGTTNVAAGKTLKLDNADALAQSKLLFNNASLEVGQDTTVNSITADNGTINISDPTWTLSATNFALTGSNIVNIDSANVGTHTLLSSTNDVTDWNTTVVNTDTTVRGGQKESLTELQYKITTTGSMGLTWSGAKSSNWNTTEANWLDSESFAYAFATGDTVVFDNSATNKIVNVDSGGVSVGTMTVSGTDYEFSLTAGATPAITATGAIDLGGATLNIVGYIPAVSSSHDGPENVQTVITSATSLSGFTGPVTVAGQSTVDFLTAQAYQDGKDIKVETRLTWNSTDPNREAHGDFTVDSGMFTLGAALADNTSSSNKRSDWQGDSLTKLGNGTLVLTAANTYTGATTISSGVLALSGNGSIAASSAIDMADSTMFDISGITATSTTVKALGGSGSVVLGSKNLAVGSGNTSTTLSSVISGAGGSLTKEGSGTLTLSGANTYSGATTVSGGILVLTGEAGNLAGSLAVNANAKVEAASLSSGSVSFNDSAAANIDVYNVTTADSILNLTNTIADNIYINSLNLGAGRTLTVNGPGSYRLSTLNVGGVGATYSGNLSADNMTLHFDLPATLAQGDTMLNIDGDVNLTATTTLALTAQNPLTMLAVDEEFTLIAATGILTDSVFNGTNTQDSYGNTYLLASTSTSLFATLIDAKSFEDIINDIFGSTGQSNTNLVNGGKYLDQVNALAQTGQIDLGAATAIGAAFDQAINVDGATGSIVSAQAVQQFFGAYSAYATQALTDDMNKFTQRLQSQNNFFFNTMLFDSFPTATADAGIASDTGLASVRYGARDCIPVGQSRIWAGGFGTWAEQKKRSNMSGYKYDSQGAILGYEYSLGSLNIGLAAAYSAGDFKIDDLRYKNETDVLNIALYGAYVHESGFFADGSLGYGHSWNDYEVDYIAVPGGVKKAKHGSDAFTANLDLGYIARLPREFNLIPSVGVEYTYTRNDSWTENVNNAAIIANQFDSGHDDGFDIPLGLRFNKMFRFGHDGGVIIPEIRAAYVYSASKRSPSITSGFQGINGVAGPSMSGVDPGRSHWRIGAGITGRINSRVDFRLGYDFETRSGFKGHNLNASVGLAF